MCGEDLSCMKMFREAIVRHSVQNDATTFRTHCYYCIATLAGSTEIM
jgi:hypothetical protein